MHAYRCGSFSKILEFVGLTEKLSSSHMLASTEVERALLAVQKKPSSGLAPFKPLAPAAPRILSGVTVDNADSPDLKWTPPGALMMLIMRRGNDM